MSTSTYPKYDLQPASVEHFSVACQPAPWSQINTRLEYDEFVEYRTEELSPERHAHVAYGNNIPSRPKESTDGSLLLRNTRPDPYTSLPRAPPVLSPAPTSSGADVVRCTQCHVAFTGAYAKGNLGRHLRHKHALVREVIYRCTVSGCDKTFARKDAKLKHARKHHPGLHSDPIKRKQGNGAVIVGSPRKVSGGSTPRRRSDNRSPRINHSSELQIVGPQARKTYATKSIYSRGQDLHRIGHTYQTVIAAISADCIEPQPSQFADYNGLPAASTDWETCFSLQHLQPPSTEYKYGRTSAPTTFTGYHSSTGMSTQLSNQSFDTSPSPYSNPIPTRSSIIHDMEEPIIHSPLTSPCSHRPIALQYEASPYTTPHDTLLSQESLPEDYFQAVPRSDASIDLSYIDPVLFQQPLEWAHLLDEDLG
ncbi:hypothetical protein AA0119_g3047 [Alternaria tenuissima]|nr:hypothetical protein AA0117_g4220 [Alternaria alternata]RYO06081.1 hypothetical protein AA0119_g3047 [Alternaria tenuissima]RYO17853.1 hypothetical protein AA0121_g5588 [Alternaria tenuissima]RYO65789.1 hypothetical protein AA0116_g2209 [Alternaria tenuissima]